MPVHTNRHIRVDHAFTVFLTLEHVFVISGYGCLHWHAPFRGPVAESLEHLAIECVQHKDLAPLDDCEHQFAIIAELEVSKTLG